MSERYQGKTVVVTGASRGLGRAIGVAFAREGARLFAGYHSHAEDAEETVRLAGNGAQALRLDVRECSAIEEAFGSVEQAAGGIDVLVNNAGVTRDNLFPLMEEEEWRDVIDTNLTGVYHCCRAVVTRMLGRRSGAIVNVASVVGLRASPGQANYAASKGGLLALTRTLAAELAPRGVRVNAVVPGFLTAGMAARLDKSLIGRIRERVPLGRLGEADEVARAVLFLASDEARYVVGQALVVDGGLSL